MTGKTGTKKVTRRQHSPEFRQEALALAEAGQGGALAEIGIEPDHRPALQHVARYVSGNDEASRRTA